MPDSNMEWIAESVSAWRDIRLERNPVRPVQVQLRYEGQCEDDNAHLFFNMVTENSIRSNQRLNTWYMVWQEQCMTLEQVMRTLGTHIWIIEFNPFQGHEWSNIYGYPTGTVSDPLIEAIGLSGIYVGEGKPPEIVDTCTCLADSSLGCCTSFSSCRG